MEIKIIYDGVFCCDEDEYVYILNSEEDVYELIDDMEFIVSTRFASEDAKVLTYLNNELIWEVDFSSLEKFYKRDGELWSTEGIDYLNLLTM